MDYRNAVFVVTSEDSCPIYNTGEELQVQDAAVSVDYEKPVCMFLVQEQARLLMPAQTRRFLRMTETRAFRF